MTELVDRIADAIQDLRPIDRTDAEDMARAAIELMERDYILTPYCNAELMPGVVCKRSAINLRHKHEAILPATGSRVEWS